jgi:hypothetical protein
MTNTETAKLALLLFGIVFGGHLLVDLLFAGAF